MGIDALITLVLGLLDRASTIGAMITTARSEGRDVTQAELDALVATDKIARQDLIDAIAAAKAKGTP